MMNDVTVPETLLMSRRQIPLADLLRQWRTENGYNTAQAGEVLGMSARTIEGIEQGRPFRYEKMLRLVLKTH